MSSLISKYQRRKERDVRFKFLEEDLPPAEKPQLGDKTVLRDGGVEHVVAIPESGLMATASHSAPGLRIFALDGDSEPLHVCSDAKPNPGRALAALGGDVLAYGDYKSGISTWCASSGARLEVMQLGDQEKATAMAPSGLEKFVVGTTKGALVFFSHRDGRDLHEVARGNVSHDGLTGLIIDIAVHGDAIVTASYDRTAAVWSAATRERVAVLRGHSDSVKCAAVCARFIATGSFDRTLRLYEAGAGHALVRVIEGLHSGWVFHVGFVGDDMLMSASVDRTVAFTSLSSDTPVARLDTGFAVTCALITPDARIACAGPGAGTDSDFAMFSPPPLVATAVENHAATVFPSSQSLTFAENEPLQAAMVKVYDGILGAGDACRAHVTKENCSRSIEEWASAHRLLMVAVERKEIPGELHFEGELSYWFANLYTPPRGLELGDDDWILVTKYAYEAKEAGVISEPEAVLGSVLGGQDLLKNVAKLQVSGQKIVNLLWKVMARQAGSDVEMKNLLTKMKSINRTQKLNAVFGFVFSFVPLGGNALAQGLVGVDQVWSLLDSTMSAGVGIHGAVTPLLLDKFVGRAASMIAPSGWKTLGAEDQVMFKEAVEALDISWEEFRDAIEKAAAQRGLEASKAIEDGAKGESGLCEALGDSSSVPEVVNDVSSHVGSNPVTSIMVPHRDDRNEFSSGLAGGLAISSADSKDEALCNFAELKMAMSDVEMLISMTNEDLSECVAAVMINFAEDLRPQFLVLASCLRIVFQKKVISGDVLVGFSKDELLKQIVKAFGEDEKYQVFDDDVIKTFEWRLERFLCGLRSK